jgi:PhoPQ-activated pathogenicity-related protein
VPNTDHGMGSLEAITNVVGWFRAVTQNYPRPRFYWRADRKAGTLTVRVVDTPTQVNLWQAANPKGRDFRLETIGPAWTKTPLSGDRGIYTATVTPPAQGFAAFMVELTFPGPADSPLVFTTEVVITPDYYPSPFPPGTSVSVLPPRELPPGRRKP